MIYRKTFNTSAQLAAWYGAKYKAMGGTWVTPPEDCNKHLDDLGVPFDYDKSLLDIGCGGGYFLAEAEKRVRCTGIEISTVAIAEARGRAKNSLIECLSIDALLSDVIAVTYDYIVSIGSIEHVINLPIALINVRNLLKPDGQWYFYNPNELWPHHDQPNERTATDIEWEAIFFAHGLITDHRRRWGACTAFWGHWE